MSNNERFDYHFLMKLSILTLEEKKLLKFHQNFHNEDLKQNNRS